MANNGVIGRLTIQLGINAAEVQEGLKNLQTALGRFAASVAKVAAGLGITMGAVTAGISAAVFNTVREIDKLAKASKAIGVPVGELSALRYAAEQNGLAFETLASGLQTLSQRIVEAAQNAKSQAAQAFEALGISVRDASGNLKSTQGVFLEIADAFSRLEDGATKTTAATRLLGSAGGQLISMLNEGSFSVKALTTEAEQLGLVLDQQTTEAAQRLTRALDSSNKSLSSLEARIVTATIPILEQLAGLLENIAFGFTKLEKAPLDALQKRLQAAEENARRLSEQIADPTIPRGIRARQEEELARTNKLIESLRELIKTRQQDMEAAAGQWETTVHRAPPGFADLRAQEQAARATRDAARELEAEGRRVFMATRTDVELLNLELMRLKILLASGEIDWDTYQRAVAQARDRMTGVSELMNEVGRSLADAFSDAILGARRLSDSLQDVLRQLGRMLLNRAFMQLFGGGIGTSGGFLGNLFGSLPGFAQGGSFKVPGPGGIDSKIVAFRASPGERVTVSKKDSGSGSVVAFQPRVVVNNYADAKVDAQSQEDGTLELTVRAIVRDEFGSERMNPIMRNKHGIAPRLRAR